MQGQKFLLKNIRMLISDLDGTLLPRVDRNTIAEKDIQFLRMMGKEKIVRVIATGRSYFSLRKVLPDDFPIDFVILSSGAGIMDWKEKRLLNKVELPPAVVDALSDQFCKHQISFFVHDPLPENHRFYFFKASSHSPDFERRLQIYQKFARPIAQRKKGQPASQLLVIGFEPTEIELFVKPFENQVNLILATSPLDGESRWVEIFPAGVSKSNAADWLSNYLNIPAKKALAIGNDYNDHDLLEWAGRAVVLDGAPEAMRKIFPRVRRNQDGILSQLFRL